MDRYLARDLVQARGIVEQSQTRATSTTTRNENPYNLEFDDLMTKEELKNIYGIVSKKEKNKKKIILFI